MDRHSLQKSLESAEHLLADVRNSRADLDRREHELALLVAEYKVKLGSLHSNGAVSGKREQPEAEDNYGAISENVLAIMRAKGRKMNALQIGQALESQAVPIRAKSYYDAARTAIRNLFKTEKIRRAGTGYYRLA